MAKFYDVNPALTKDVDLKNYQATHPLVEKENVNK